MSGGEPSSIKRCAGCAAAHLDARIQDGIHYYLDFNHPFQGRAASQRRQGHVRNTGAKRLDGLLMAAEEYRWRVTIVLGRPRPRHAGPYLVSLLSFPAIVVPSGGFPSASAAAVLFADTEPMSAVIGH